MQQTRLSVLSIIIFTIFASSCFAAPLHENKALQAFIQQMSATHQFKATELEALFDRIKLRDDIIHTIKKPAEKTLAWDRYRAIFITPKRTKAGLRFWRQHQTALKQAEQQYGVPAAIIVAIIGVESFYGRFKGKFRVLDSLTTLAFFYPQRSNFFRSELEQYLLLTRELKVDPLSLLGSYAGAMGPSQFMPSSYRKYAANFSGKPTSDLIDNNEDIIASVANYLKQHGWQKNKLVTVQVSDNNAAQLTLAKQHKHYTVGKLAEQHIKPVIALNDNEKVSLVKLDSKHSSEYWLGLTNFDVIKSYNPRDKYAMAVFQLAEAIKQLQYH